MPLTKTSTPWRRRRWRRRTDDGRPNQYAGRPRRKFLRYSSPKMQPSRAELRARVLFCQTDRTNGNGKLSRRERQRMCAIFYNFPRFVAGVGGDGLTPVVGELELQAITHLLRALMMSELQVSSVNANTLFLARQVTMFIRRRELERRGNSESSRLARSRRQQGQARWLQLSDNYLRAISFQFTHCDWLE